MKDGSNHNQVAMTIKFALTTTPNILRQQEKDSPRHQPFIVDRHSESQGSSEGSFCYCGKDQVFQDLSLGSGTEPKALFGKYRLANTVLLPFVIHAFAVEHSKLTSLIVNPNIHTFELL